MKKYRILHVTREFSDLIVGGIEQSVMLAAGNIRQSHQVLALGHPGEAPESNCHGFSVFRVFPRGSLKFFPWSLQWFRLLGQLAQTADVIHLHSPFPLGELSVFGCQRPVVCTYHSDIVGYGWIGRLYSFVQKRMIQRSAAVVVTSPSYVESSNSLGSFSKKLYVVPFGLPMESVDPEPPKVRMPPRFFLFLGSDRRYKGLSVLLEAYRLTGFPIVFAGVVRPENLFETNFEQVFWLGSVTESEKSWLLKHADALILPSVSRAESFGIVLLEAMRLGRPCICTSLGTGTDWVVVDQHTGLVVDPNNPSQLADAMRCIYLDGDLRKQMGLAGRARFEREFGLTGYHQKLSSVYQRVLV